MADLAWVKVARVGELEPGTMKRAEIDPLHMATLINIDGEYYALDASCPHQSFPLWAGRVLGHRVVCPGHSWVFDARTGNVLAPRDGLPVRTYPVRVEADAVYLGWEPPSNWGPP